MPSVINKEKYDRIKFGIIPKNNGIVYEVITGSKAKLYRIGGQNIGKNGIQELYGCKLQAITYNKNEKLNFGDKLSENDIKSFFAKFKKEINQAFLNNPNLYDLKIECKHNRVSYNQELWSNYETGKPFYHLDIKNGYWQMLMLLGYISFDFYEQYLWFDEYKMLKRVCLTMLVRKCHATIFNANPNRDDFVIKCNTSIYDRMYLNVRNHLINSLMIGVSAVGDEKIFKRVIDGVYLHVNELKLVKKSLAEAGITYKYTICRKIGSNKFLYNMNPNNIRNMIPKRKKIK
jgi:hypothetical protein